MTKVLNFKCEYVRGYSVHVVRVSLDGVVQYTFSFDNKFQPIGAPQHSTHRAKAMWAAQRYLEALDPAPKGKF